MEIEERCYASGETMTTKADLQEMIDATESLLLVEKEKNKKLKAQIELYEKAILAASFHLQNNQIADSKVLRGIIYGVEEEIRKLK